MLAFSVAGGISARLICEPCPLRWCLAVGTHQLKRDGAERGFNAEYLGICAHYGIEPRTINVARPQENGDCESSHGHLKRRIRQHLQLRGSRDFASEEEYDRFLAGVLEAANRLRTKRFGEDLAAMRETAIKDLPDYRELMVSVGNNSTIHVRKQSYSVPGRLIGVKLLAHIYENRIVLLVGAQEVAQLPLGAADRDAVIDFRHLIGHLLRKPGAFAGYRWREEANCHWKVDGFRAQRGVYALVIGIFLPAGELVVELLKGADLVEIPDEELVTHSAEESFDFSFGRAVAHGSVD